MSAAIPLRSDFDAVRVRCEAKQCGNSHQTRRLLAVAAIYDGLSRLDAARIGGMDRQTLRDWVVRFNAEGPCGLRHRLGAGRPSLLSPEQKRELGEIVEVGPDRAIGGVVRWRRIDLVEVIKERFGVICSERVISDFLAELGFSHMSVRPQHAKQDERVIAAFKKTSPSRWQPTSLGSQRTRP
jgi:transposase